MLDKEKTKKAFSLAAKKYDQCASWQQQVARELVSFVRGEPGHILDLGCGTGEVAFLLQQKYPNAEIHGIDLASGMIARALEKSVANNTPDIIFKECDMEQIDYPAESFNLVISNLSLQWLNDFERCFSEVHRILKPQGSFLFSVVGDGSLPELSEAYEKTFGSYPQKHNFPTKEKITETLNNYLFQGIRISEKEDILEFDTFKELAYSMKNIGGKAQGSPILTKTQLKELENNYLKNKNGKLTLTYKTLIGDCSI